jgi:nicotinamidase/pyrazinamidase
MELVSYGSDVALVVVDVQNDFADPDGNLYVDGGEEVVAPINEQVANAREAGSLVVYTQDWHPPSTPHFVTDGGEWPVHCVRETWGAELHPDLDVDGPIVRKGVDGGDGYSGFSVRDPESGDEHATELGGLLDEQDAARVVVVGLAEDVCVHATVLDARRLGYEATMLAELTRPVDPDAVPALHDELVDAGATIVTD